MKIKVSLRMEFLGYHKITIKKDDEYTTFDSCVRVDNNLEDDSERVNGLVGEVSADGAFDVESLDASFHHHIWGNLNVASYSKSSAINKPTSFSVCTV
jgi:hypothetical protein